MFREEEGPMRSPKYLYVQPGAKLHYDDSLDGHPATQADRRAHKSASPIVDTREPPKAQSVCQPNKANAGSSSTRKASQHRLPSPVLKQKLAEMLKAQHLSQELDLKNDRVQVQSPSIEIVDCQIDPDTYQRVLMKETAGIKSQSLETEYKGGLGGIENPFRRDHFTDMQDIAEAKQWRILFKHGLRPERDKDNSRYMDVVKSLVAAGDFTTPLEEAIAAERERLKDIPLRPFVGDHFYDAMFQLDRRHARAPSSTNQTLMNGTDDLEDAWPMPDGGQHGTIMPIALSSRQSTTRQIDTHLRKREKQRKKEAILLNYGLVGWGSEGLMPRRSGGSLFPEAYPLASKAYTTMRKILSTDAMLKEEDRLEASNAEGEEFDLVWATKINYLTHKQPYVIKRRGDLDEVTETEGLEIPPPPANDNDNDLRPTLSERQDRFWGSLSDTSDSETGAQYAAVEQQNFVSNATRRSHAPLRSRKRKHEDTAEIEAPARKKKNVSRKFTEEP